MNGYIHSFETFGTVDGPGMRFVLFLKGCPLRCAYCHNPDTWAFKDNAMIKSVDEVVSEILKYKRYYQRGGVTISGGEPMMQIDFLTELAMRLKENGLHVAIDTSGSTYDPDDEESVNKILKLMDYVDLFLLDIKHINDEEHKKLTGKSNKNILKFARFLDEHNKDVWIRHVLVPGITTQEKYLRELKAFIDTLKNVSNVEILPYHTLGVDKYKKLGLKYRLIGVPTPTNEEIKLAKDILLAKSEKEK